MSKGKDVAKLLGQCFFVGFEGLDLPPTVQAFIQENSVAGVTLFANNYESPAQVAELVNSIQALRGDGPPLAIAVDHEGGKVQRFRKHFTKFPEARVIGDQDSPKLAYECAEVMAKELKTVGVNLVFAPVADINTNPGNPVIGHRAYGVTEERVSKMVSAYVRGFITNGVQCVVKHFPGHGDTSQDSHFHLPKIKTPLATIMEREVRPFVKAFKARCEMVMTAHIMVEAIEPKLPATMSHRILNEILRDQLRFRGLIISDDMEMKAIADHFGETDAGLKAIEAGVDILLYHTEPFQTRAFEGMLSKLTTPEGKKALARLEDSAKRVTEYRARVFTGYKPVYIPEIASIIGSKEHLDLAKRLDKLVARAAAAATS
ncbi:MAG: beta-N-acetylhexosaminidase [Deltaproteobacteria bacterium]|nr:beta-N-acetylhexosaminidase [Deltaproteobacteria bacterium]